MAVTFQLPQDVERKLREAIGNLDQVVKEAALVELYRQDRISQHELALAMGLDRLEVEALLKDHDVTEDLLSGNEYNSALF